MDLIARAIFAYGEHTWAQFPLNALSAHRQEQLRFLMNICGQKGYGIFHETLLEIHQTVSPLFYTWSYIDADRGFRRDCFTKDNVNNDKHRNT